MNASALTMANVFLKIFLRDRQAIFFIVFFPIIFMTALGYGFNGSSGPQEIGVIKLSSSKLAENFLKKLNSHPEFNVTEGSRLEIQESMDKNLLSVAVVLPKDFESSSSSSNVELLMDSSQLNQVGQVIQKLQKFIIDLEREVRQVEPLIQLNIEDIQDRPLRYIDFLLPGLLAFTLMQISISGSGFNIVEFRRKGILKRLFVTPLKPKDFIIGVVIARLLLCLVQLTLMLCIAIFFMGVSIAGNIAALYFIIILGTIVFLCIGFSLGSIAKTQQSIQGLANLVIFPQMFLSGIFYPIQSLPEILQPIAAALPLSFIATALREISTNGMTLLGILPNLAGIATWLLIGFFVSTRYFVWKEVAH